MATLAKLTAFCIAVCALAIAPTHGHLSAQVNTVVGTGTPASCTESALISAIALGGKVTFNCGAGQHSIPFSTYKSIAQPVEIDGGGKITLSGNNTTSLFQIFSASALTLTAIALVNGRYVDGFAAVENFGRLYVRDTAFRGHDSTGLSGGAAILNRGVLRIENSIFFNNRAVTKRGGAILSTGGLDTTLLIKKTAFVENAAQLGGAIFVESGQFDFSELVIRRNLGFDGGALYIGSQVTGTIQSSEFVSNTANYGGAIEASGKLVMTNTTFSSNTAQNDGGAIWFVNATGPAELNSVTFANNRAPGGNSINLNGGSAVFRNSIFARAPGITTTNCVGMGASIDVSNVSDDNTCGSAVILSDIKLGPLQDNGGLTLSHAPLAGSPLIDAVLTCPPTDQRGAARPSGARCDIGAIEVFPGGKTYLPLSLRASIATFGTSEIEPNNGLAQANGPLQSGVSYQGMPNDADDYFRFEVTNAGPVTLALTGHTGEGSNRLQLQLRNSADGLIQFDFAAPFTINESNLAPGTYYVRIFYADPGPYSSATPYTLKVTKP